MIFWVLGILRVQGQKRKDTIEFQNASLSVERKGKQTEKGNLLNFEKWRVRPGSDAELFMSRTEFEFGPSQINKSQTPNFLAVPTNTVTGKSINTASGFQVK